MRRRATYQGRAQLLVKRSRPTRLTINEGGMGPSTGAVGGCRPRCQRRTLDRSVRYDRGIASPPLGPGYVGVTLRPIRSFLKRLPFARAIVFRLRAARLRLERVADRRSSQRFADPDSRAQRPGSAVADELSLTRAEWRDQGATPDLLARARSASRNSVAWNLLSPRMWLVYAAVLIEAADEEAAARVLRTFLARRAPADQLAQCLPVARFARELGVAAPLVERSAAAADVLDANIRAGAFADLVRGKTIAVVGNGPGCLGRGLGTEIDAHDLVVRFNNFPGDLHATDYGHRTDIWVRGAHKDVRDRPEIESFSLVVWEMDLFRNLLEVPTHGDILYRDTQFAPDKITHIDSDTKQRLWERSGLVLPTSGLQILWMLYETLGTLKDVDVYGFSTIDGGDTGHYFDELGDMGNRHNVEGEGAFISSLLTADECPAETSDGVPSDNVVIVSCAYRNYDPATGKTGGPGGVLATQQLALGQSYRGHHLDYRFRSADHEALRKKVAVVTAALSTKVSDIVVGAESVRADPELLRLRDEGKTLLFVCHELGTAFGAYLLRMPYVLVYHQQGSTLQEMRSIGREPTVHEISVANRLERLILENAQQVYFPSLGARETYKSTSGIGADELIPFATSALYNTVSAVDHAQAGPDAVAHVERVRSRLRLPVKTATTDVFVSVGDFNEDKGLDRVPALLQRYTELSGREVVWIAVGAGGGGIHHTRLTQARSDWNFTAVLIGERLGHDDLLALLAYADYYVMLHRNSIFDLATLEAMRAGKALVLSPIGGNLEVNLDGNVLFVDEASIDEACRVVTTRDRTEWGEQNRRVFEEHFSLEKFAERYRAMLDEQLAAFAQQ